MILIWLIACTPPAPSGKDSGPAESAPPADSAPPAELPTPGEDDQPALIKNVQSTPITRSYTGEGTVLDGGASFEGSVRWLDQEGDTVHCDATVALSGTALSGACETCTYAFAIDASVAEETGDACAYDPLWTWIPSGRYSDMVWAWFPEWEITIYHLYYGYDQTGAYYYTWVPETTQMHDLVAAGASVEVDGEILPGPYFYLQVYDGDRTRGSARWDGDQVSWSYAYTCPDCTTTTYETARWLDCGDLIPSAASVPVTGDAVSGTLPCDAPSLDTWTLPLEAGETVGIGVDVIDPDQSFDPSFWVNAPDGCTALSADDNVVCTAPNSDGDRCPAGYLVAEQTGTYEIVVASWGDCPDRTGAYVLQVAR